MPEDPDIRTGSEPGIDWRSVWPIPVLLLAGVLLVGGIITAFVSRPKPDIGAPLRHAAAQMSDERFEDAIKTLNTQMLPYVNAGKATPAQVQEFYRSRAEAMSLGQAALGISRDDNNKAIVDDYHRAEAAGLKLAPSDVAKLTEAYLALDQISDAADRVRSLPESETERRRRLTRLIVEHNLASPDVHADLTLELLTELAQDPRLSRADQVWTAARQSELLIEAGSDEEASTRLVREIARFTGDVDPKSLAELRLLLGRSYLDRDDLDRAAEQFQVVEESVAPTDPLMAPVGVYVGRIHQLKGENEEARDRFDRVRADFPGSRAYLPALLGLAEVQADMGDDEAAVQTYAELVDRTHAGKQRRDVNRSIVRDSLLARQSSRYLDGSPEALRRALAYADLADSLYADGEVPAPVLLAEAQTHRALAESTLRGADGELLDHRAIRAMDPVDRSSARHHLVDAGRYFLKHADEVLLSSNDGYLESIWAAADSFDLGGDLDDAASAFSRYRDGAEQNDQRRPESQFRLAQIFQAKGEYTVAEPLYKELIDARTGTPGASKGVGRWADQSIVPLARCYLADKDKSNDPQAESLLKSVVEGDALGPGAVEFREALLELASLKYRTGEYARAAELFEQAVSRYPDDERIDETRFKLADSYRLLAGQIGRTLKEAMPTAERQARQRQRHDDLVAAMDLYRKVKGSLGARPADGLTDLDRIYLRNSAFYIGDCAFDLGQYEEAIRAYGDAADEYANHPSSLVAKVQIVNAYVAMGQWDNARTAQERARQQYKTLTERFGDAVWDDPSLPMEQKHWERWLQSGREIQQQQQQRAAASP